MDGNKFKDCRFRIDHGYEHDWGPRAHFLLQLRCTKTVRFTGVVEYWKCKGVFETREEARAHYELIKDLPEYLP